MTRDMPRVVVEDETGLNLLVEGRWIEVLDQTTPSKGQKVLSSLTPTGNKVLKIVIRERE